MGGGAYYTDGLVAVGDCRDDRGRCGVGWWKSGEANEVTEEELMKLAWLCGEVTPGPWMAGEIGIQSTSTEFGPFDPARWVFTGNYDGSVRGHTVDSEFVCLSREAIPALLAEVSKLRKDYAKLRDFAERVAGGVYGLVSIGDAVGDAGDLLSKMKEGTK